MSDQPATAGSDVVPPASSAPPRKRMRGRARGKATRPRERVWLLLHDHLVPPADVSGLTPEQTLPYQAELDVLTTLRASGHAVEVIPVGSDLAVIERAIRGIRLGAGGGGAGGGGDGGAGGGAEGGGGGQDQDGPGAGQSPAVGTGEPPAGGIVFNLIEAFANYRSFDQHVVAYLECLGLRYTGCNPRGMTLSRDKALTKKILAYHRVRVPAFHVFEFGRSGGGRGGKGGRGIKLPRGMNYPVLVKSATDDGSVGITRASVVQDEAALRDRVAAIHEQSRTDAIAEQFIEGRELYLGVFGNRVATTLPVWELDLSRLPEGAPRIVTERMKRSLAYQKKYNIDSGPAALTEAESKAIRALGRRVYHLLGLSGYARLDLRMTAAGEVYLIEANPNPQIARDEDFARSAAAAGLDYPELLGKLLSLAQAYRPVGLA